jgi:hypothetical protein
MSNCADLTEVIVFSKQRYLYDAQHTQARRFHNCDSFRRCEKADDILNHTWTQPIQNNLRSHCLGQQTLSSVGVNVSDYFYSSPKTHFWSFSGCAADKEVSKTYLKVYYCDMWSRSVTARRDNTYSRYIYGHVAFQIQELDRRVVSNTCTFKAVSNVFAKTPYRL